MDVKFVNLESLPLALLIALSVTCALELFEDALSPLTCST